MNRRVPEGWASKPLGELADIIMGQAPPGTSYNGKADGTPLLQGNADFGERHPSPKIWTSQPVRLCAPDDILISVRAPVGELNIADREYCLGRGVAAVRTRSADTNFVYHVLSSAGRHLTKMSTGSTFEAINKDVLEGVPILLPPFAEQEKIAEVLGSVDTAITATRRVIKQTRSLKRALMQELLTRGIPGRHTRFKDSPLGKIPADWKVVPLRAVTIDSHYGTSVRCSPNSDHGLPVLRIPNVVNGYIDTTSLKYASLDDEEVKRLRLKTGDLLFVRTNGNYQIVGKATLFEGLAGDWLFASYLIRVRVDTERLLPEFVRTAIELPSVRRIALHAIRTSAGNYNINSQGIARIPIPLPPLNEQEQIVNILQNTDARLNAENNILIHQSALKAALLYNLLSGEIRALAPVIKKQTIEV